MTALSTQVDTPSARLYAAADVGMLVIGLDAGGTKTVCLLADASGEVRASARGPGANLASSGELEVEKVLYEVMEQALADRSEAPAAICLGIAGVDRPEDAAVIHGIMRRIARKAPVLVVNDALVALEAGAGDGPGLVIVAGTGSICYGRNAQGKAARAGGFGYILADEGSGWWLGQQAARAAVRASDGRGPSTTLLPAVLAHFGVADVAHLVQEIYHRDHARRRIAALGPCLETAAAGGDVVARQIVTDAAGELVTAVRSVAERLELRGAQIPVVLAGGIFRVVPSLEAQVIARVAEVIPRSQPRRLEVEPAVGAVRLALAAARGDARLPTYI